MDYTNFVKNYYKIAMSKLNKYSTFHGTFVNLNYGFDIDPQYLHKAVHNLDVLPNFDLNIDAPLSEYEKFFEYYDTLYPELNAVFPTKDNMYNIFNLASSKGILSDEMKTIDYIELVIDISLECLFNSGVLK